ncbi:hypothetical protein GCM10019016_080890 [Streptomyces prasinosporus]|uniref:Transposase n=1 Tax=Streptomyces prasinosporus TaxID=68256 RepID=A0ABP6U2N3_9ACTN|nr:hypothetical protein GCM10010332_51110 [Streptomyces albogriseolus]
MGGEKRSANGSKKSCSVPSRTGVDTVRFLPAAIHQIVAERQRLAVSWTESLRQALHPMMGKISELHGSGLRKGQTKQCLGVALDWHVRGCCVDRQSAMVSWI